MAILAACKNKAVKNALPYLSNPESKIPGEKKWFYSSCNNCSSNCPIQVKTFDNRPIKIEGNANHKRTSGGVCAIGHVSLFELYNINRLKGPAKKSTKTITSCPGSDMPLCRRPSEFIY